MERCWLISGRVQGVGFRYWVLRQAAAIGGLSGYAMNTADGEVLVLAAGAGAALEDLERRLYHGPLFARVDFVREVPEAISQMPEVVNGVFKRI